MRQGERKPLALARGVGGKPAKGAAPVPRRPGKRMRLGAAGVFVPDAKVRAKLRWCALVARGPDSAQL